MPGRDLVADHQVELPEWSFAGSAFIDGDRVLLNVGRGGIALNKPPVDLTMVTPIARLTTEYEVVVVPSNSPHKTIGDLVKAFKAEPGKVSWGGGSAGGTDHILVGLIAKAVGADPSKINYVPFKGGGEAITSIIGGHVAAGVSGLGEFAEQIKAGRMRALAVSSPKALDGIASLKEQGIDVELGNWRGVFAAPGITPAQRDTLIAAVKAGFTPLVIVAALNSLLSVFYYLRIIVTMYMLPAGDADRTADGSVPVATKAVIAYASIAVVWAGIGTTSMTAFLPGAAPLLNSAKASMRSLTSVSDAPPPPPAAAPERLGGER
jgi:hypothetical protein